MQRWTHLLHVMANTSHKPFSTPPQIWNMCNTLSRKSWLNHLDKMTISARPRKKILWRRNELHLTCTWSSRHSFTSIFNYEMNNISNSLAVRPVWWNILHWYAISCSDHRTFLHSWLSRFSFYHIQIQYRLKLLSSKTRAFIENYICWVSNPRSSFSPFEFNS
jgi:hypothetical protein